MRIQQIKLFETGPFEALELTFPECGDEHHAEVHIFIGPNGCGKSSLLYALASIFRHNGEIEKRFWREGQHPHLEVKVDPGPGDRIKKPLTGSHNLYLGKPKLPHTGQLRDDIEKYQRKHQTSLFRKPAHDQYTELFARADGRYDKPTRWAAFSYAGRQSTLSDSQIDAIAELKTGPFGEALSFQQGPGELLKWIGLMASKAAIEQGNGNSEQAARFKQPLVALERALGFLLDQTVQIKVQTSPFSVTLAMNGRSVDVSVLPDGVKSFLGWLGDLISRLDRVIWQDERDILSQNFILFLDEIDIHMHPTWQRKVLPVVQSLFPNAQIFCSTHSPFVVNSVDSAIVHCFRLEEGLSHLAESLPTSEGLSVEHLCGDQITHLAPKCER